MDELIAFLRARYDERAAAAEESHYEGQRWLSEEEEIYRWPDDELVHSADRKADARHIALNDPAHVLADIAGKRKIVDMAEAQHGYHLPEGVNDGRDDDERKRDEGVQVMLVEVLHCVAEEFATHPEYRAKDWGEFVQPQGGDR